MESNKNKVFFWGEMKVINKNKVFEKILLYSVSHFKIVHYILGNLMISMYVKK